VVKFGGAAMEDRAHVESVLADIAFMECVGMSPVIVHGGGKAISRGVKAEGIEPTFVKGLRVTCEKTIDVVERVIKTEVNPALVRTLKDKGAVAKTLDGEQILRVTRKSDVDASGAQMDWGFVGDPHEVATDPIWEILDQAMVPVITPLGMGPDGKVHNVNADVAAAAVAKALQARKLVFLSDVPGLLRDPEDEASLIGTLHMDETETLIEAGVIRGGMLPKVRSGVEALRGGVRKVHLVDGRMKHSLLLEIFTIEGVGTQILAEKESID
jgi:acetylglutamate kinase